MVHEENDNLIRSHEQRMAGTAGTQPEGGGGGTEAGTSGAGGDGMAQIISW